MHDAAQHARQDGGGHCPGAVINVNASFEVTHQNTLPRGTNDIHFDVTHHNTQKFAKLSRQLDASYFFCGWKFAVKQVIFFADRRF